MRCVCCFAHFQLTRAVGSGGAYRIGSGPSLSSSSFVVVVCQHFQTTSPLGPKCHLWHPLAGASKVYVFLWKFALLFSCYGNLVSP